VLKWGGVTRSVESIVLIANGISFAIMTVLFVSGKHSSKVGQ